MTAHDEDYVNQTIDRILSWRRITSCTTDSDTGLENQQQRLHEVSTRRCARIDRAVKWVGTEIREPPSFHEVNDLEVFLAQYEDEVVNSNLVQYLLQTNIQKRTEKIQWQIQTLHRDFSPGNPNRENQHILY
jgi:hypothetical protein